MSDAGRSTRSASAVGSPAPPVALAATVVPVAPLLLLTWQLGWLLAPDAAPTLDVTALAIGAGVTAGLEGRTGARHAAAAGRRGRRVERWGARSTLALRRLALVAAIAAGVRLWSPDPATAVRSAVSSPGGLVDGTLIGIAVVLALIAATARATGRLVHGQSDPRRPRATQRAAERSLIGVLTLVGAVSAGATMLPPFGPGPPEGLAALLPWTPVAIAMSGGLGLAAARRGVLIARDGPDAADVPTWAAWWRVVAGGLGVVAIVVAFGAAALSPVGPVVELSSQPDVGIGAELESDRRFDARPPPDEDAGDPRPWWALATVAALAVLVMTRVAGDRVRERRSTRVGWRELLALLRAWFGPGEPIGAPAAGAARPTASGDARVDSPTRRLLRRLRRRPRDPTAAILHDYRGVQHRLDAARRRPAETARRHAERVDRDALHELADLVSAVRYTTHRATTADADRSRELTRRLRSRDR